MRLVGLEGTAWAASAAVYDTDHGTVVVETEAYQPETGGIDPSEATEHMRAAIPEVIDRILDGLDEDAIDAVAFSRGPGLGPCLRVVATAARTLAGVLDVPLVGVNHMLAHAEVGRHTAGFDRPVCLNASGANAHLLGFHGDRYRVLGETMDTGVGNALDKFTRHLGWSHPGGPKVERHAREGAYVDLPYVVKGMDFSFSGLTSAAKEAVDDGVPIEDVCHSLQETVFGMLTEVSERALSLTGGDELVLGGGVGQNRRLQAMLETMCDQRGAAFHAPEDRFLRDNAGMIAVLGAEMYRADDTLTVEDSRVRPRYRPDEVPVTWRSGGSVTVGDREWVETENGTDPVEGAEATVTVEGDRVRKRRLPKRYRHPGLDDRLRRERTRMEARLTSAARRAGVPTPVVYDVDPPEGVLVFERVGRAELRDVLQDGSADGWESTLTEHVTTVGRHLATLHDVGIVHGDPTPRNVRVGTRTTLVDFGLGYHSEDVEDFAMDLHVFEGSLGGTVDDAGPSLEAFEAGYRDVGDEAVIDRLRAIEGRGRYRERRERD
jgi:N6-L-threonylcarbamoyladenine synthase/protein kinase Bud32